MKTRNMGNFAWARHEEELAAKIASRPGEKLVDVGVGHDFAEQVGLDDRGAGRLILPIFEQLTDGGCDKICVHAPFPGITIYARRRGRSVDVGTRKDFEELGWKDLCDLLDKQS